MFNNDVLLVIGAKEGAKKGAGTNLVSYSSKTSYKYLLSRWSS